MRLVPREGKFFEFFLLQAKYSQEAARLLQQAVKNGDASVAKAADEIAVLERKGDEVVHSIFTKLNQTFITPMDPEDLHSLGSYMDDVLDAIEEAAHRIRAYKFAHIPAEMNPLCDLIVQSTDSLQKAFRALADGRSRDLMADCVEINRLEEMADQITRGAIAGLFESEKDPVQLMKLKEVYDLLELTTDYAEDVADALQGVVVKNG